MGRDEFLPGPASNPKTEHGDRRPPMIRYEKPQACQRLQEQHWVFYESSADSLEAAVLGHKLPMRPPWHR